MPTIEFFTPRELGPKEWGSEMLVAETDKYIGKILSMEGGKKGGFQYHERKDEAFVVYSGRAIIRWLDKDNVTQTRDLFAGDAVHIPPGAAHQVEAVSDCVLFETSTPVFNDRVPVPEKYWV